MRPLMAADSYGQWESLANARDSQIASNYFNSLNAIRAAEAQRIQQQQHEADRGLSTFLQLAQMNQQREQADRNWTLQRQQEKRLNRAFDWQKLTGDEELGLKRSELGLRTKYNDWQMGPGEQQARLDKAVDLISKLGVTAESAGRIAGVSPDRFNWLSGVEDQLNQQKEQIYNDAESRAITMNRYKNFLDTYETELAKTAAEKESSDKTIKYLATQKENALKQQYKMVDSYYSRNANSPNYNQGIKETTEGWMVTVPKPRPVSKPAAEPNPAIMSDWSVYRRMMNVPEVSQFGEWVNRP